jgi:hypothetical protein
MQTQQDSKHLLAAMENKSRESRWKYVKVKLRYQDEALSAHCQVKSSHEYDPLAAALALGTRSTSVSTTYVTIVNPLNPVVNGLNGLML